MWKCGRLWNYSGIQCPVPQARARSSLAEPQSPWHMLSSEIFRKGHDRPEGPLCDSLGSGPRVGEVRPVRQARQEAQNHWERCWREPSGASGPSEPSKARCAPEARPAAVQALGPSERRTLRSPPHTLSHTHIGVQKHCPHNNLHRQREGQQAPSFKAMAAAKAVWRRCRDRRRLWSCAGWHHMGMPFAVQTLMDEFRFRWHCSVLEILGCRLPGWLRL